MAFSGNANQIN